MHVGNGGTAQKSTVEPKGEARGEHKKAPVTEKHMTKRAAADRGREGVRVQRRFTEPGVDVFSTVTWQIRSAGIADESGKAVFEQTDVEVPDFWSQIGDPLIDTKKAIFPDVSFPWFRKAGLPLPCFWSSR